jgi:hypothetical protein
MIPNLDHNDGNDEPTRPINDGPALLKIKRLARLARERLAVAPDDDALALACTELQAIEAITTAALR